MYYGLIAIFVSIIICGLIIYYFGEKVYKLNKEYKGLKVLRNNLQKECKENEETIKKLDEKMISLSRDINEYTERKNIAVQRAEEAKTATDRLLATELERARTEIKRVKEVENERMNNEFKERQVALDNEFQAYKKELEENFGGLSQAYMQQLAEMTSEIEDFQAKRVAINEAIRREKELQEQEEFYSINILPADQEDIQVLQSMDVKLHNHDVIPKLIWELFIRRPCQEMIKRVTGGRKIGGVYKITYKKTGEAYIGKTTDFSTRWQNHCKTAIGLEGAARTTLHNRMAQDGLWNYTFEILEEVDKENLSVREGYYIDLYGTKTQLNMKEGSK